MYSRYIPNENGGFERREIPDRTGQRLRLSPGSAAPNEQKLQKPIPEIRSSGHDPPASHPPQAERGAIPQTRPEYADHRSMPANGGTRPRQFSGASMDPAQVGNGYAPGGPRSLPGLGSLFGPDGPLGQLLPRKLETEDLLVLAVLLLAMKQDEASGTELLIAAALYFFL